MNACVYTYIHTRKGERESLPENNRKNKKNMAGDVSHSNSVALFSSKRRNHLLQLKHKFALWTIWNTIC